MCWKHGDSSAKQKLIVYNEVIRSNLLYGLDAISVNSGVKKALDAFQMRGLRKIMKMPSTFLPEHHHYTNAYVLQQVNDTLKSQKGKEIIIMSEFH